MSLSSPLIDTLPNNLTNGTTADASQVMANFNAIVNDILSRLNASTGAGYVGITSDTRWGGGASVQDALGLLKDQQQLSDTGSVNALVITPAGSLITANVTGFLVLVKPGNTTTNITPTLKVGTAPAVTIVNGDGSAHVAGAIQANRPALFWIDTVNSQAVHINPLSVAISFTLTLSGMASGVTGTINARISVEGHTFFIWAIADITGTSNSAAMNGSGIPASIQTAILQNFSAAFLADNGVNVTGFFQANGATWTFGKTSIQGGGFTTIGVKGIKAGFSQGLQQ